MGKKDAHLISALVELMVANRFDASALILKKITARHPEMGKELAFVLGFQNHPKYRETI